MKRTQKRLLSAILALVLLAALPLQALAQVQWYSPEEQAALTAVTPGETAVMDGVPALGNTSEARAQPAMDKIVTPALRSTLTDPITEKTIVDSMIYNGKVINAYYTVKSSVPNYDKDWQSLGGDDFGYCCAALVKQFYKKVYGVLVSNLNESTSIPSASSGSFFVTNTPQIGDIMRSNSAVHWAIVKDDDDGVGNVSLLEQNWWENGSARINREIPKETSEVTYFRYSGAGTDSDYDYLINYGNAAITRYRGSSPNVNIPSFIGGLAVNHIWNWAFSPDRGLNKPIIQNVTIPNSVTTIGLSAFENCRSLQSVTIPNNALIGDSAFCNCTSLKTVALPDQARLGYASFRGCLALQRITLPGSQPNIPSCVFEDCSALQSVLIPQDVKEIAPCAFMNCSALTSVYFMGNAPTTFSANAFSGCAPGFTIYYRAGTLGWTTPLWNGYKTALWTPAGLAAPTLTLARTAVRNVGLTWNRVAGANGYSIYRGTGSGDPVWYASSVDPWYSDTGAAANTTYRYTVMAYNNAGSSAIYGTRSNIVTANLSTPVLTAPALTLAQAHPGSVGLTWNAVSGATGYSVYRGTGSGVPAWYANAVNAWYTDVKAAPGTTYSYFVKAYKSGPPAIYSPNSRTVTAAVQAIDTPTVTVARTDPGNVSLTWSRAAGATGYSVYRGTSPSGMSWYAGTANPWFSDTGAAAGTTYYYQVMAYAKSGGQAWYGAKSRTTTAYVQ